MDFELKQSIEEYSLQPYENLKIFMDCCFNTLTKNYEQFSEIANHPTHVFQINVSIYIKDLPDNLMSNPKLFVDDTSLFSVVRNIHVSSLHLKLRDVIGILIDDEKNRQKKSFLAENTNAKPPYYLL